MIEFLNDIEDQLEFFVVARRFEVSDPIIQFTHMNLLLLNLELFHHKTTFAQFYMYLKSYLRIYFFFLGIVFINNNTLFKL